ncbi:class D sortase [Marivibrio halodurans]|uniref:Class D sortase n=1 Tax=Marivibrio halodurans TaxID=2039722 RepID=A0A8J7S4N1_9PROT|nr:class D sortase [Marivibrio halodurans]MBP5856659.1 class D sortase [Marivibrio halodurans]
MMGRKVVTMTVTMMRRVGIGLAMLAIVGGVVSLWRPALLWAKAWAAPVMIEHAWESATPGEPAPPPWPWADGRPVAVLSAPDLGIVRYVLDGASARVLAFGPARLSGAGPLKPTILFGHRDTHFRFLERIEPGTKLTYTGTDRLPRRYIVTRTRVADARTLRVPEDPDALVLVTCWPFESSAALTNERYVVTAWPAARVASPDLP